MQILGQDIDELATLLASRALLYGKVHAQQSWLDNLCRIFPFIQAEFQLADEDAVSADELVTLFRRLQEKVNELRPSAEILMGPPISREMVEAFLGTQDFQAHINHLLDEKLGPSGTNNQIAILDSFIADPGRVSPHQLAVLARTAQLRLLDLRKGRDDIEPGPPITVNNATIYLNRLRERDERDPPICL